MVRRTARATGRAETFHSPSSPERRCVPAVVPSRSVSSPSPVGKVDDPRPVALTWGGAGVDHTPYPIPQAPHTRLGHYSPIANSQNSFLKACTEEFFRSEIFWNLPWIGCVRRGVWGMGYGVRIGRYPIPSHNCQIWDHGTIPYHNCQIWDHGTIPYHNCQIWDHGMVSEVGPVSIIPHTPYPKVDTPDLVDPLPSRLPKFLSEGMH